MFVNFFPRFYITTKMPNPHFLPEICIKVNVINFTVTSQGLEDQLLAGVVMKEQPELEDRRNGLIVKMSNDKKQVIEIEDKILKLLSQVEGNPLDDETLIDTLGSSKTTADTIQTRVRESEETEVKIST